MPRFPKSLAAAIAAASLVLGATACADESTGPEAGGGDAQGTDELSISATGVDSVPYMAMLQAGVDMGWFEEEGLNVDLFSGGGGGNTLRVVTSGDADMAIAGQTSVLLAAQQPAANLTVIAPWFQVVDLVWISPPGRSLEGATLGFSSAGSSSELIVKGLEQALPGIRSQAVGGMGDNWTATLANQITAGFALQPFIAEKQRSDNVEILVSAREVLGDLPSNLVAVNTSYAEANPENLRTFFRVADRLNDWVINQPDEAAAEIGPLVGVSPEVMRAALDATPEIEKAYSLNVDPADMQNLSDLMVSAGQISEPVDWATVLDQQYLPEDARAEF